MPAGTEQRVWFGSGLVPSIQRAALLPLSALYSAGWLGYRAVYCLGLKRAVQPHRPIVCVGNLVVGGSGKSPVALHLADLLRGLGRRVVVSCSGYGSPRQASASWAPDGPLDPGEWGDEPAMLRWLRPELELVVGRDRVAAARLCAQHAPDAVLLLDDGFQHLRLAKDVSILLDDPSPPNPFSLPAGPYREPRSSRRLADLVLPGRFRVEQGPLSFLDPIAGAPTDAPEEAVLLCALGRPDRFERSLAEAGVRLSRLVVRTDHDPLLAGNLLEGVPPGATVVTSAKDWVKIRRRSDLDRFRWVVALLHPSIEPADDFRRWLADRIDEVEAEQDRHATG